MPALAAAWKMPARGSRDQAPMAVLGNLLAGDEASRLYQGLVKQRQIAINVDPLYGLTDPWSYNGPTLFTLFALYRPDSSADAVLAAIDEEVAKIAREGVDATTLKRVKTRMLADWYNGLESFIERADTVARMQTLWGDAQGVNKVPGWIDAGTSADLQRVAKTYVTRANRTVIDRRPAAMMQGAAKPAAAPSGQH